MGLILGLAPAYGRDYKSKQGIVDDLLAGKDFQCTGIMENGRYVNLAGLREAGVERVTVRYKSLANVTSLDVRMDSRDLKPAKAKAVRK